MPFRLTLEDKKVSKLDDFVLDTSRKPEKMSKSRGNCVTVDMVVNGVAEIAKGYEFRDTENRVIEKWKRCGIWRNRQKDGFFYTGPAFQRRPVFLCKADEIIPALLIINGEEKTQHPCLFEFWDRLHAEFPDEFVDSGEMVYRLSDYESAGVYSKLG